MRVDDAVRRRSKRDGDAILQVASGVVELGQELVTLVRFSLRPCRTNTQAAAHRRAAGSRTSLRTETTGGSCGPSMVRLPHGAGDDILHPDAASSPAPLGDVATR